MLTFFYGLFSVCLVFVLLLGCVLTWKMVSGSEKSSPFECGFDPSGHSRLSFCMKFFIVGVVFLVFDVEVALILALFFSWGVISFLMILVLGLVYEWYYGGLDWLV